MKWVTSNLLLLLITGSICFFVSFVRVRLWFIRPIWKWFSLGATLLAVGLFGIVQVAVQPPGEEKTVDQIVYPKPVPPDNTHLQRLRDSWNSESNADWPVAETLAEMSEIAYLSPVDADSLYRLLGFTEIMPIVASSMIGYVVSAEDVTAIVFRGTDSAEVSDWMANLGRSACETQHGPIHKGFFDAYRSLQPQIMTVFRKRSPQHLWVTGHSLGGALALACAFDLIDYQKMQIDGLMTFGQPMVARKQLAEHLEIVLLNKYAHFVNNSDIVPRVPPSHTHCGSLVWFSGTSIKRSAPKIHLIGAVGAAGDTPQDDKPIVIDELQPLSEAEFQEVQSKIKLEKQPLPELPKGQQPVGASLPMVDDHSMELYLQKVRRLLGISETQ